MANVISAIRNSLPKTSTILTKAAGVAALGLVAYDAHTLGKIQANLLANDRDADSTAYYLKNTLYSDNLSKVSDKVKRASFRMELDCHWKRVINTCIGYVRGFTGMLIEHVVPLTLGLGALFAKGKVLPKICAGGLGVYGAYAFVKDFFGLGMPKGTEKLE